ncbi:MAG: hypothetical protein PHC28_04865 [Flavobacterium sp.]|uniref:hypothetical protein n=1 Tax=Flavobacterium sp. TaxID=239 RepID=UPI00260B526C|nr:hypothetical protein [Flavobacterium sp.]MDD5149797.1 hypothetical protein [Flavobacterium sp.]
MTNKPYIIPREKPKKGKPKETKQEELCRRLEEYIEFNHARKEFILVEFHEALLDFIENKKCTDTQRNIDLLYFCLLESIVYNSERKWFADVGFYNDIGNYIHNNKVIIQ